MLAGVYFFTDYFGERSLREGSKEVPSETTQRAIQVNEVPSQIANDPNAGVLINDQNIQIEREEVEFIPGTNEKDANLIEVQGGTFDTPRPPVKEVKDIPQVPSSIETSSSVKNTDSASSDTDETKALEMSIPPVPDM